MSKQDTSLDLFEKPRRVAPGQLINAKGFGEKHRVAAEMLSAILLYCSARGRWTATFDRLNLWAIWFGSSEENHEQSEEAQAEAEQALAWLIEQGYVEPAENERFVVTDKVRELLREIFPS